jgi:glyoxylase-like metal-dependent hydrolase (beta-lactamase superfamily II)
VSFVVGAGGADAAVFTGDSLFVGGCGRFFEGNPTQVRPHAASLSHTAMKGCESL